MTDTNPPKNNALEALAQEADTIGAAPGSTAQPTGEGEAAPAAGPTNAQIIAVAIGMGRDVFCAASTLQSPKHALHDEEVKSLGEVWGAVCDKHGWQLGVVMGDYGAEIAALVVTVPIVMTVRMAVMEEIRARKAKPVEPGDVVEMEPATRGS